MDDCAFFVQCWREMREGGQGGGSPVRAAEYVLCGGFNERVRPPSLCPEPSRVRSRKRDLTVSSAGFTLDDAQGGFLAEGVSLGSLPHRQIHSSSVNH